jgi:hypothetical protein
MKQPAVVGVHGTGFRVAQGPSLLYRTRAPDLPGVCGAADAARHQSLFENSVEWDPSLRSG